MSTRKILVSTTGLIVLLVWASTLVASMAPTPSEYEDSQFSDKVLYVTTTRISPKFPGSTDAGKKSYLASVCELNRPAYVLKGSSVPLVQFIGALGAGLSETVDPEYFGLDYAMFQEACSLFPYSSIRCMKREGRFWFAPNRTTQPRLFRLGSFGGSQQQEGAESIFVSDGSRPNDKPLKYWTGVDINSESARACSTGNVRWANDSFINVDGILDFLQGASVGNGIFGSPQSETWAFSGVERCNQTLPIMCMGRSRNPTLRKAFFLRSGQVEITFDLDTDGQQLGVFPCSDILALTLGQETAASNSSLGLCTFVTPKRLIMTPSRTATFNDDFRVNFYGQEIFSTFTTEQPPLEAENYVAIHNLHALEDGVTPVLALKSFSLEMDLLLYSNCLSDAPVPILQGPPRHSVCNDKLVLDFHNVPDGGRRLEGARLVSDYCPEGEMPEEWFIDPQSASCSRDLTPTDLDTYRIEVNTSYWRNLEAPLLIEFRIDGDPWYPTECPVESNSHYVFAVLTPYADVYFGRANPDTFQEGPFRSIFQNQPLFIQPEINLDLSKCIPAPFTTANATLKYLWQVYWEDDSQTSRRLGEESGKASSINNRQVNGQERFTSKSDGQEQAVVNARTKATGRQRQLVAQGGLELILNRTTPSLSLPKHSLLGPRALQMFECSDCMGTVYFVEFRISMVLNATTELEIFGPDYDGDPNLPASFWVEVDSSDIVVDVKAQVSNGVVTVDARGSCDPDVATTSCDPIRKYVASGGEFRGLWFEGPPMCEVFDIVQGMYSYRECTVDDFVDGTFGPTRSPTLQPSASPQASPPPQPEPDEPTPSPTVFYDGRTTFTALKPGLYRFRQNMIQYNGQYYGGGVETGPCSFQAGPEYEIPTGQEPYCLLPNAVIVRVHDQCDLPQVSTPGQLGKITVFPNTSATVSISVLFGTTPATQVQWDILDSSSGLFIPLGPSTPIQVIRPPGFLKPPTRPTLVFPPNSLAEGSFYRLRLTAPGKGSGCTPSLAVTRTIEFTVNERPIGGTIVVSPTIGTNFLTEFALSTSGWTDVDVPIRFSFEFLTASDSNPSTLSSFSTATSITTKLSSTSRLGNFVVVVAQDALGAKNSVKSGEITLDRLYVPNQGAGTLPKPQTILQELDNADADSKLRTLNALASAAVASKSETPLTNEDGQLLKTWRKEVAEAAIDAVVQTRSELGGGASLRQVALQVNTLLAGLSSEPDLGESTVESVSELVQLLLGDAQEAFLSSSSETNLAAIDLLPTNFGGSLLNVLTELSKGIELGIEKLGLRRRRRLGFLSHGYHRRLQPAEDATQATYKRSVENLRASLQKLVTTLMQGYEPGAPIQAIQGVEIEMAVARESRALVGEETTTLSLGDITVTLPPSVLDPQYIQSLDEDIESVDVVLVRFKFNIRELVASSNLPPGFDPQNITVEGAIADDFEVQQITTLLFLSSQDPSIVLDPSGLAIPINVTVPLPPGYTLPNGTSGLELVCGAWDIGFAGWSSAGAKVTAIDLERGTVTCSSTHASDFAAWNAFVANLGGGPVGIIATVAIVVVGIMLPLVIIMYALGMIWARIKDKRDADGVHSGALLILTKNKLRLRAKQRKFFKLLRENAQAPKPLVVDQVKSKQLRKEREEAIKRLQAENDSWLSRKMPPMLVRWFRAIWYDHSLVGLFNRFDPYYTRMQRVTVVTSVVCGNLFIASFFFDLKTANDITFGFMVGVVFLAALVVAIPVKLIVRVLFRLTEAVTGSTMDRVTQIYRVSMMNQDIVPVYASAAEQADIEMILAFREYYLAKGGVVQAQALLDEAKRRKYGESLWDRLLICLHLKKRLDDNTMQSMKSALISRKSVRIVNKNPDQAEVDEITIEQLEDTLKLAQEEMQAASRDLQAKCAKAKEEWEKVPKRRNARVETLRKQQSAIMKFAALLYDEAEAGPPRERVKRFRSGFLVFAWAIVLAYLVACLVFTAYWIIAYTSQKPGTVEEQQQDADAVILAWLVASVVGVVVGLFIAEPAIQLVRFALIPWCLTRYGNGIVSSKSATLLMDVDDDVSIHDDNDAEEGKKKIKAEVADAENQLAVRPSDGGQAEKQARAEEFIKQTKERRKGEKHAETAGIAVFDLAAEVVEALA